MIYALSVGHTDYRVIGTRTSSISVRDSGEPNCDVPIPCFVNLPEDESRTTRQKKCDLKIIYNTTKLEIVHRIYNDKLYIACR